MFQSEERHAINFRTSFTISNSKLVVRFLIACQVLLLARLLETNLGTQFRLRKLFLIECCKIRISTYVFLRRQTYCSTF